MSSEIEIPALLELEDGLIGLPDTRHLTVHPIVGGQFVELVDSDEPALGWLAASAEDVRPGMATSLTVCGLIDRDETLVVLLASHGEPPTVTANLAGPLAIRPDGRTRQLVLEGSDYDVRARVGRLLLAPSGS